MVTVDVRLADLEFLSPSQLTGGLSITGIIDAPTREGTTNPELLQQKHPAAVLHVLDALHHYAPLSAEQVLEIAFEIGMLGQRGLDYADPAPKYTLRTLPGEPFTDLHLMCRLHRSFKRLAPEHDTGRDLDAPFLTALEFFNAKEGRE